MTKQLLALQRNALDHGQALAVEQEQERQSASEHEQQLLSLKTQTDEAVAAEERHAKTTGRLCSLRICLLSKLAAKERHSQPTGCLSVYVSKYLHICYC